MPEPVHKYWFTKRSWHNPAVQGAGKSIFIAGLTIVFTFIFLYFIRCHLLLLEGETDMNINRMKKICLAVLVLTLSISILSIRVAAAATQENAPGTAKIKQEINLKNDKISCSIFFHNGQLESESIEILPGWTGSAFPHKIELDGDFAVDVQWTDWTAPGEFHNAANPVLLTKKHFKLVESRKIDQNPDEPGWILTFKNDDIPLDIRLTYKLEKDAFYVKRQLSVRDPKASIHFLRWIWPRRGMITGTGDFTIIKEGGFGSPTALKTTHAGAFFGLEYPTAENSLKPLEKGKALLSTGQEMGMKIGNSWISSEWTTAALTPDLYVKLWFNRYLEKIRVVPLKPYLLYNTWYDVRSPEYTNRPEDVMNETNLLRIIGDFKREMVEKRGLKLDAFVLDDAWDIYKSDWALRQNEFPNGLKPITDALKSMGAELGIWFGPTGGYSKRDWRIEWMKAHGYEVVGDQLCVAGTNYHNLLKKRVTDFVRNDGVSYFKWDGIQFSCSEPDHGHPIDIYSRRAVMESVIDLSRSVREINPNMFLNITSGTWLSPWWTKYANQIWMQGFDYGYAGVPSISQRDSAITYRDYVLYEDFGIYDIWFPISNLMTHGIIKGHLQKLGGEKETLDKFTNDVILYFARGVSMWELYISPNLLTDSEWEAIGKSIRWAKNRFDILKQTEMVGGNPGKCDAYGYMHFLGKQGIAAVRNPSIDPKTIKLELSPAYGLCPKASSLVVERVYPTRWISPRLYSAGAVIELPLKSYETAIYEIYPLDTAPEPLLADATFNVTEAQGNRYGLEIHGIGPDARILNPGILQSISTDNQPVPLYQFKKSVLVEKPASPLVTPISMSPVKTGASVTFSIDKPASSMTLSFLLEVARDESSSAVDLDRLFGKKKEPTEIVSIEIDGKKTTAEVEQQEGNWAWYNVKLNPGFEVGKHSAVIHIQSPKPNQAWKGKISAWIVYTVKPGTQKVNFQLTHELPTPRPLPPLPFPGGEIENSVKLGEISR